MTDETFLDGRVRLLKGDCLARVRAMPDNSIDSVVTDPPYALVSIVKRFGGANAKPAAGDVYARASAGFMGKTWDTGETAFAAEFWREVLRVLKPGGHVVAASGTRTYHRLAVAIEDAGFEIRDMVSWLYGSGFPKSHDVSKGIDKAAGAERAVVGVHHRHGGGSASSGSMSGDLGTASTLPLTAPATAEAAAWQGWGTALKPACEPWVLARKPLIGTVAANVLAHGTGALNIDGCRVATDPAVDAAQLRTMNRNVRKGDDGWGMSTVHGDAPQVVSPDGRWPANVVHDGSDEVVEAFPEYQADAGSAARFFYSAKANANDRLGSKHPTVKPVDLMRYLVRLITPPRGVVLDPFAGTGTTGQAAFLEGMSAVLIERETEYQADIARRMSLVLAGPDERAHALASSEPVHALPLFGGG